MERRGHWNTVYTTKGEREVSWFEALPALSLQMMEAAGLNSETCVLDVGGAAKSAYAPPGADQDGVGPRDDSLRGSCCRMARADYAHTR